MTVARVASAILAMLVCGGRILPATVSAQNVSGEAAAANAADPQAPVELSIQGDRIFRWREADADLYYLEGNCRGLIDRAGFRAENCLLRIARQPDAFAAELIVTPTTVQARQGAKLWGRRLKLRQRPTLDATSYRGRPEKPPALAAHLPERQPQMTLEPPTPSTSPVRAVQYEPRPVQYEPPRPPGSLDTRPQAPEMLPPPVNAAPPETRTRPNPQANPPNRLPQPLPETLAVPPGRTVPSPQPLPPGGPQPMASGDPPPLQEDANRLRFLVGGGAQAVEVLPRNDSIPPQISLREQPLSGTGNSETVVVARGGVTVIVRDAQAEFETQMIDLGAISLSADRIVGWMPSLNSMLEGGELQPGDGELYLEGDIVFRQGDRVIYADRMYYNVAQQFGMVLDAEVLTSIPEYEGIVRLKAELLQQIGRGEFVAFDAAVTTSRMGVPRYWLQSNQLRLRMRDEVGVDPTTGQTKVERRNLVSSRNNFVYVGGLPVLWWPVFTSDLERSNLYLSDINIKNDNIFGTQVFLEFDLFQILGIENPPDGVDWTLSTDYLSERGPAIGTQAEYLVPGAFGFPGPVVGYFDIWGIDDQGTDFLGVGRQNLPPEQDVRGRALLRHRHYLPADWELIAEVGYLSDRNFLEQYLENEWDRNKNQSTLLKLRKYYANQLFDLTVQPQVNDFFTRTQELPRFDHYGIGNSLLGDRLTWSVHNQVSNASLEVAEPPDNPAIDPFATLPGEVPANGVVAATRQEISAPVQAGPVKVVPYLSGEAAHFGEDINGQSNSRLLGQGGVRWTLPMWKRFPTVQSNLLNIRSLAHKLEWRGDVFYADSDTPLSELPYDQSLDDDAQTQFRRRFLFDNFGGPPLPQRFDPRNYAFRQGMQRWVTAPVLPIADDLLQTQLGLTQRWQTKRGLPGRERITDLVLLDIDFLLFPKADRDNFGEVVGPARYDFRYHVGDRVTLLSDGYVDFFNEGLRSISAGVMSSRPGLGDIYVGFLSLEGPISSNVLRGALNYRLNEKWIVGAGTTFDLGAVGNVGQNFSLTRIGESGLLQVGVNVDSGRDNVGFVFSFEPRFLPKPRLGNLGGQMIPPPGVEGLE